jgi:hypothetical protein
MEEQTVQGRVAYDVETPDVNKMASNSCLKAGELFPETTGFSKVMQKQVISINNFKEYILKKKLLLTISAENAERN